MHDFTLIMSGAVIGAAVVCWIWYLSIDDEVPEIPAAHKPDSAPIKTAPKPAKRKPAAKPKRARKPA
jgi:hypothetical protein